MNHPSQKSGTKTSGHASVATYTTGFLLSIGLTLVAYILAANHMLNGWMLVYVLAGLAILQLTVQLLYFLHIDIEAKPRWNLTSFLFALLVVVIVVIGSIWIMHNLDYNMMPHEVDEYIFEEEGIRR